MPVIEDDELPVKVRFGQFNDAAYLDTRLPDDTYTGTEKHTGEPVHLRYIANGYWEEVLDAVLPEPAE